MRMRRNQRCGARAVPAAALQNLLVCAESSAVDRASGSKLLFPVVAKAFADLIKLCLESREGSFRVRII